MYALCSAYIRNKRSYTHTSGRTFSFCHLTLETVVWQNNLNSRSTYSIYLFILNSTYLFLHRISERWNKKLLHLANPNPSLYWIGDSRLTDWKQGQREGMGYGCSQCATSSNISIICSNSSRLPLKSYISSIMQGVNLHPSCMITRAKNRARRTILDLTHPARCIRNSWLVTSSAPSVGTPGWRRVIAMGKKLLDTKCPTPKQCFPMVITLLHPAPSNITQQRLHLT